ncbi:hypothetical protein [Hymenobacter ruricola]|uniref:BACON domain-containing protein n=1 Tax=Hymenobacter ruricola TaxID=2791023 RepID=A0ABS0HZZ7_9BACT|nr:hypothetical protein [Hymenobacter ruricola]MBF9220286.1 hypothetical protein [Hymenobacter ruricola]
MTLVNTSNGNTTTPPAPKVTVGIRNVFGKLPQQVNGAASTSLPICSGGQPVTLTLPVETFAGVPGEVINDYIWAIPPTWTVQNATRLTDSYWSGVSASTGYWYYLGGRSITVTPPVGEGNKSVFARFYNRFCFETTAFNNLISGMISAERRYDFVREPTFTVFNVPTTVNCGEQTGFTPTATASQSGVTFTYSVPAGSGWLVNTVKGVLKIVPSGSGGTTLTVTPTYNCSGATVTGTPKDVAIGFNPNQATPVFNVPKLELCPGVTQGVSVQPVPGATSYTFSGITAPLTLTQSSPGSTIARITVPASLVGGVAQTLHVVANSGFGCAPASADIPVKAGYGDASLDVIPAPAIINSRPTVCAKSSLTV